MSPAQSHLLVAAQHVVSAWRNPTMDGMKLSRAMQELEDAFREAATEHRLATEK